MSRRIDVEDLKMEVTIDYTGSAPVLRIELYTIDYRNNDLGLHNEICSTYLPISDLKDALS